MQTEKVLVNNEETFNQFINTINKKIFSFDTETTGLDFMTNNIVGISFHDGSNKSWYIPINHNTPEPQLSAQFLVANLSSLFNNVELLIGQNITFDIHFLNKFGIEPLNVKWFDTKTAAHLINENSSNGLKQLALEHFNYKMETFEEVSKKQTFNNISPSKGVSYACDDAIYTYKLYEIFKTKLAQLDLNNLYYNIEIPFLKCIYEMEKNGIGVDTNKLKDLKKQVDGKLKDINEKMLSLMPSRYTYTTMFGEKRSSIDISSPKQLSKLLFEDLKLPIIERSKKTNLPSTGVKTLTILKSKSELVATILEYRKFEKLRNGFIDTLPNHIKSDGKIHTHFNNTGTVTGRLSSSEPNCQQWPKNKEINIRSCFISDPKTKFVVLDYSQEELRIAAFLSQDQDMIKAYKNGLDLHLLTANKIFNLNLTEIELKEGTDEYSAAKHKFAKERNSAKAIVFGILYGMTEFSLSERLNISVDDAKNMIEDYFKGFPLVKKAILATHIEVKRQGYVKNYFGRYRRFQKVNGFYSPDAFRKSYNFKIQGLCSDLLRLAMGRTYEFLKQNNNEAKLIFTVHDEFCVQVPEEKADWYLKEIKKIMENVLLTNPPLIAEGSIGSNYAEAK